MQEWQPPRVEKIDQKLRDDFRILLNEYGIVTQETDPMLAVLFRSLAKQVEQVYDQAAERIPLATLDELMAGLGMPERCSRSAQSVIRFSLQKGQEKFDEGTEFIGESQSKEYYKERPIFALDTPITISSAVIFLVAIYQNGLLQLHFGSELPKELSDAKPSLASVPAELGPNPAIFIAFDVPDEGHLSNHGLFFELAPNATDTLNHLQREVWCLFNNEGEMQTNGLLRSKRGNAGVRKLEFLSSDLSSATTSTLLPDGFYGGKVFIFPEIPPDRRFLTRLPRKMEVPIKQLFQRDSANIFAKPRVWLRIGLPQTVTTIAEDMVRIVLHCTSVSNVEVLNQTLVFDETGTSIPLQNGGGLPRFLVSPISIKGERGSHYLHYSDPTASTETGRYRFHAERLEIEPAQLARSKADRFANVRLLLSNGKLANAVGMGNITTFLRKIMVPTLDVTNLVAAAGGTDGERFDDANRRFAELLLSRERAVTHADIESIIKAFEPKVQKVMCEPTLEREPEGLCRTQRITVALDRRTFTSPDEEANILKEELQILLQKKALLGIKIRVVSIWI